MAEGQTSDPGSRGFAIGAGLKEARQRIGMDVKQAEERTKIRARYLRALEAEDWEALPAAAYVRGFLRTYGSLLGLDGGMLADEYRRRHESAGSAGSTGSPPAGEPIRAARGRSNGGGGRSGGSGPSRGTIAATVLGVIVLLIVVLGVLGSGEQGEPERKAADSPRRQAKSRAANRGEGRDRNRRFVLEISPATPMIVCLVAGGEALIDSQILAKGAEEKFRGNRRYRLELADPGELKLAIDGEGRDLVASGEQSFEITSNGVEEVTYAGPDCP